MRVFLGSEGKTIELPPSLVEESELIRDLCGDVDCDDEITIPASLTDEHTGQLVGLSKEDLGNELLVADYLDAPESRLIAGLKLLQGDGEISDREYNILFNNPELRMALKFKEDDFSIDRRMRSILRRLSIHASEYRDMTEWQKLVLKMIRDQLDDNDIMRSIFHTLVGMIKKPYDMEMFFFLISNPVVYPRLVNYIEESEDGVDVLVDILPLIIRIVGVDVNNRPHSMKISNVVNPSRGNNTLSTVRVIDVGVLDSVKRIVGKMIAENHPDALEALSMVTTSLNNDDISTIIDKIIIDGGDIVPVVELLVRETSTNMYWVITHIINMNAHGYLPQLDHLIDPNEERYIPITNMSWEDGNPRIETLTELLDLNVDPRYYTTVVKGVISANNLGMYKFLNNNLDMPILIRLTSMNLNVGNNINSEIYDGISKLEPGIKLMFDVNIGLQPKVIIEHPLRNWILNNMSLEALMSTIHLLNNYMVEHRSEEQAKDILLSILQDINPDYASVLIAGNNLRPLRHLITNRDTPHLEPDNSIDWGHLFGTDDYDMEWDDEYYYDYYEWYHLIVRILTEDDWKNYSRAMDFYSMNIDMRDVDRPLPTIPLTVEQLFTHKTIDDYLYKVSLGYYRPGVSIRLLGDIKEIEDHPHAKTLMTQLE